MSATLAICVTSYYHRKLETMTTKQEPTLTILHEGTPIFTSHGKWLYPLLELEAYLAKDHLQPAHLLLQDKIIGKAAALLIHRLGFHTVKAGVLSRLGEAVLQRHGMAYRPRSPHRPPCAFRSIPLPAAAD